eukprot:3570475-Ditylum_brightwellii.AAC.1
MVLLHVHHFMSRLRELFERSKNRKCIKIRGDCLKDLRLMLIYLEKASEGVSLNMIVHRKPTHVYRSDSCPNGLGGNSHQGYAWRFYLPEELKFRTSNNLLEHMAAVITPWVDIKAGRLKTGDCSLSISDSTILEGWTSKTNIKEGDYEDSEEAAVKQDVARHHTWLFMEYEIKECSQ